MIDFSYALKVHQSRNAVFKVSWISSFYNIKLVEKLIYSIHNYSNIKNKMNQKMSTNGWSKCYINSYSFIIILIVIGFILASGCVEKKQPASSSTVGEPTASTGSAASTVGEKEAIAPSDAEKVINSALTKYKDSKNNRPDMVIGVLIHEASFQRISVFTDSDRQKAIELAKEMGVKLIKTQQFPFQYSEDEFKKLDKFRADVKANGMMISMLSYGIDWKYYGTVPFVMRGKADWETYKNDHAKWTKFLIERYHPDIIEIESEPAFAAWTQINRDISDQEWYDNIKDVAIMVKGIDPSVKTIVPLAIKDRGDTFFSDNNLAKMLITNPPQGVDIIGFDFYDPNELDEVDELTQIWKQDKKVDLWIYEAALTRNEFNNQESENARRKWLNTTFNWAEHNGLGGYVMGFLREPSESGALGEPVHEFVNDDWSKKDIFYDYQNIINSSKIS